MDTYYKQLISSIMDELVNTYKLSCEQADEAIEQSNIKEIYSKFSCFVLHYSVENWSENIYKLYLHTPVD